MRVSAFLPVGLALGMFACSNNLPPASPPSFGRAQRVAFACMEADGSKIHPLGECEPTLTYMGDTPTVTPSVYSLNALVTQSNRGEVAAVDLVTNQVIDARQDIPGYTFVPTGELPGAIVVPPDHPELTYVANAGSRDISVINTLDVRHLPARTQVTDVRVPVRPSADQGAQAPFDMLLSPNQDALFVTAPDAGWLLRLPLIRCDVPGCRDGQVDIAGIVRVPIEDSLDKAPKDQPAQTDPAEPYSQICDPATLVPQPTAPAAQVGTPTDRTPRPAGLALDAFCKTGDTTCHSRLIVADRNLPILHVIDIDVLAAGNASDAVLTPIVTGVPTERVAVSPRVPVDIGKTDQETQYVYAIDLNDGSVLVAQNGQVISVSSDPTVRADRLDVGYSAASGKPVAQSLELLYPGYDLQGSAIDQNVPPTDPRPSGEWLCGDSAHITRAANRLRGVFLAVGLTDGTVRIIDVFDAEMQYCRSCDADSPAYDPYPMHRHRPRINAVYVQPTSGAAVAPILTPSVTPQFQIGTSSIYVNSDGTTNDPRVPGLACVACTGKEAVSFPPVDMVALAPETGGSGAAGSGGDGSASEINACAAGEGRVCSLADPWIDPFNWVANREGPIPGAHGGLGRFVDASDQDNQTGSLEFAGEALFCSSGVLGDDDIGDVDGNGHPDGDQVQITAVLPDADVAEKAGVTGSVRADCEALVAARDNDDVPIGFRITQAYGTRLVIDPDAITQPATVRTHVDYAFVRTCFLDSLLTYEVHARQSYIVVSLNGPGFLHTVVLDPTTQRCVIDKSKDPKRVGRAYDGVAFDNGFVSFKTARAPAQRDIGLNLTPLTNVPKLVMDATQVQGGSLHGVLPVQLKYNDIDQRLYIVDISTRGLIPVSLGNFPSAVLSSFQ